MNNLSPLTNNQKAYLKRTQSSWLNVAEGGKRGGKNVLNTLAYCLTLENHPDRLHLIAGASTTTARLNIMDCDGMGLTNYFEHRCKEGKYKDRACLYVQTVTGEKIILVSGGGKNGDERYIKGNTYGTAYITEVNECAESFVKEVFDRTMTSNDRKIFHDLNPKDPKHWYYIKILKQHEKLQREELDYGYNYGHFTIADNMSVSNEKLTRVLKTYEKGTVWYRRDIKGERCTADGIIFESFANNPSRNIITTNKLPNLFKRIEVGFDIGGNKSAYALTCSAIGYDDTIYVLKSEKTQAEHVNMNDVEKLVTEFCQSIKADYGKDVEYINTDHVDVIINSINDNTEYRAGKTYKPPIADRPFLFSKLLANRRLLFVNGQCDELIDELCEMVFDDKAADAIPLDDGTMQIDAYDSLTYSISGDWNYLKSEG